MSDKIGDWLGKADLEAHGLRVYLRLKKAKTVRGKDRIWINIRQKPGDPKWRQAEVLGYINGADIQFEKR